LTTSLLKMNKLLSSILSLLDNSLFNSLKKWSLSSTVDLFSLFYVLLIFIFIKFYNSYSYKFNSFYILEKLSNIYDKESNTYYV
jgi:hypothetical protein